MGAVALPASIILAIFAPSIGAASAGWKGIFGHKQNCAAVCTMWLITALHWKCHSFQRQLVRAIYILMCVFLIVMSGSRTGWALVAVVMVTATVLLVLQRMRRQEMFLSLALVVPAVSAAAYVVHKYYALLAVSSGKDATLSQRTVIWSAGLGCDTASPVVRLRLRRLLGRTQRAIRKSGSHIRLEHSASAERLPGPMARCRCAGGRFSGMHDSYFS